MESFKRYEKQVPGHRIQIDVKFLTYTDWLTKNEVKRYPYTATLMVPLEPGRFTSMTSILEQNAIDFADRIRAKFPFRIHTIQTKAMATNFKPCFTGTVRTWASGMCILKKLPRI